MRCREFLNADLIAAGLAPFAPETQNLRAGRLMLERIREMAKTRETFGFETTLSGRTYVKLFTDLKNRGYQIELFFLWLPTAEMAVKRVANRVEQGGHNVPQIDIRRRYTAGLRNLFQLYQSLLNTWWLYDASSSPPILIAGTQGKKKTVSSAMLYRRIKKQASNPT